MVPLTGADAPYVVALLVVLALGTATRTLTPRFFHKFPGGPIWPALLFFAIRGPLPLILPIPLVLVVTGLTPLVDLLDDGERTASQLGQEDDGDAC